MHMHDESEVFVEIRLTCSEQLQTFFFPNFLKSGPTENLSLLKQLGRISGPTKVNVNNG